MLLGILVLAGWFFHLSALKRVALGSSPMVANAAVAFVLDGLALVLIARRRPRAAWIGAAISLLAGILTLVEYGLSCDLGFDRWLIAVTLSGAAAPGRLAPNTAVAFVFCGLALSCAARRSFFRGRQALVGVLGSIVMGMGTASAFGYLIDYPVCSWGSWTPMAAGTAVGCMALGLGVILVATLDGRLHTEAPEHWPAVAAGSAGATITLSFAQALHTVLHAHFGPVSDAGVRLGRNAAASPEVLLGWSYHGVILSVVAVGITISVLIALLVGLALGARRRAKAIQKVNEKLENEIRERKQVEQQLLGSEERFRGAFEQAPYGMCLSAIDGHLLLVNRTFCQLVGRSEPELLAGGWQELTHPEDLDLSRAQLEQLLGGQVPCLEFEKRYLDRERNVIWAQVNTSLLRDREGAPSHFVTHVADISARRRAEIDLRNREERFRAAFEYAPFGIASSARDRRMNSTLCRMVGYSEAELLARNWDEITHADDRAVSPEAIARLEREGPEWVEFEKRYLHKQGRAVWARVRLSRAPDSSEGWHLVTHIEDVTERKRVEEASRTNEERVRQLLDSTAEAIYGLDMDGNCTFANAACLEMLGYAGVGALIGKNMHALAHHTRADGSAYPVAQCRIYKALLREEKNHVDDEVLWRADGASFPAEYWSYPVRRDGKVVGAVVAFLDITERKAAAEELIRAKELAEAASHAKSRFLANMSHEIRTPLNGVIGMSRLLLDAGLSQEQRRYADLALQSAETVHSLLDHILDLSKIEAGRMTLECLDFDLRQLLAGAAEMLAIPANRKGLELTCLVSPEAPSQLRGDPGRLRQVIGNLAQNAVKFTEKGEVAIRVKLAGQGECTATLEFSIRDTGIGIPKERAGALFSPFVQADESTTRKYGGTGLGLAISKQLVELMGGRIGVDSEQGRGSTF